MKGYLLDTNLISEILKKRPSQEVLERLRLVPKGELFSSSVCIMELRFGTARHPNGRRLWERIKDQALKHISILPLGFDEAAKAGEVLAALEASGTPIGLEDVLIGSTALVRGLTVATRNVKHFARIDGLMVESWWD